MDKSESKSLTPTPSSQQSTGRHWADTPIDKPVNYSMEMIGWEEDQGSADKDSTDQYSADEDSHVVKVSENTGSFLTSTFAMPVPNRTRRQ